MGLAPDSISEVLLSITSARQIKVLLDIRNK